MRASVSSKRWLDRAAVWGIGAAIPVVCVLGLWLLASARGGRGATPDGSRAPSRTLAAAQVDASAPPSIELHPGVAPATAPAVAPNRAAAHPAPRPCDTRPAAGPAESRKPEPRAASGDRSANRCPPPSAGSAGGTPPHRP